MSVCGAMCSIRFCGEFEFVGRETKMVQLPIPMKVLTEDRAPVGCVPAPTALLLRLASNSSTPIV
jgi:hypothetical protein